MNIGIIVGIALAVLCAVYGVIIFMAGSGTGFFLIWFVLAALILLQAFLPWLKSRTVSRYGMKSAATTFWGAVSVLLRMIWIAAAIVVIVTWSLIATQFHAKGSDNAKYIVVLGSQVYSNGPSVVLKYRLDTAARYLEEHPDTICVVSGGQGWNEPKPEADVMKQYLVAAGIGEDRIIEEKKSRNTVENIRFSRLAVLNSTGDDLNDIYTPVCIVTNNFHVYRAVGLARHQWNGISVYGLAADSKTLYLVNNMLRESLGILKDFVMGNL